MKSILYFYVALIVSSSALKASVTINFEFSSAYTASGASQVAPGTIGVLVANTGTGFSSGEALIGSTLSVGSNLGTSKILAVMNAFDFNFGNTPLTMGFSDSILLSDFTGLTLGTNSNTAGTDLAFYWFPGLTSSGSVIAEGQSYGYYRTDLVDLNSGADMSFNMPQDGFTFTLAASSLVNPESSFQANSTAGVAGIPEPSRMILALVGFAGLMLRRRR